MISLIYGTDTDDLEKILEVHAQGGMILCPVCNSELLVLNTWEAAAKHKKAPGIHCPISESHVHTTFLLADRHDEVWHRFEQRIQSKGEDSSHIQK